MRVTTIATIAPEVRKYSPTRTVADAIRTKSGWSIVTESVVIA